MTEQKPLEPWQWPEEHWRKLVNQVRAGRTLRPKTWKDGARCAFAISFDSDHETNEFREGGKSIGRRAWGQSGRRAHRFVGLFPAHPAHHQGNGTPLRFLADGRRGLL